MHQGHPDQPANLTIRDADGKIVLQAKAETMQITEHGPTVEYLRGDLNAVIVRETPPTDVEIKLAPDVNRQLRMLGRAFSCRNPILDSLGEAGDMAGVDPQEMLETLYGDPPVDYTHVAKRSNMTVEEYRRHRDSPRTTAEQRASLLGYCGVYGYTPAGGRARKTFVFDLGDQW